MEGLTADKPAIHKYEAKMRLFMSVDLIGATKAKFEKSILPLKGDIFPGDIDPADTVNTRKALPVWHNLLLEFHYEFYDALKWSINYTIDSIKDIKPQIWKRLGDEIIYVVELENSTDVIFAITAMLIAIKKYRGDHKITASDYDVENEANKLNGKLNIKSTFWMAGFPLVNMESPKEFPPSLSELPRMPDLASVNRYAVSKIMKEQEEKENSLASIVDFDFMGPSMDTGFRLASKSDRNRIVISFEIAYLLAKVFSDNNNDLVNKLNFEIINTKLFPANNPLLFGNLFFDGCIDLKGVFKGKYNYPIFYLTSPYDSFVKHPSDVFRVNLSADEVIKKCEEFMVDMNSDILKPYIPGDKYLNDPPEHYLYYLKIWDEQLLHSYKVQYISSHNRKIPPDEPPSDKDFNPYFPPI
ncbi:MAG: hypothetical protein QM537_02295 [Candidatus Symbiobacter sp.]|nr:hypothetical protein [Candidatus Symbiobacter sp.]